MNLKISKIKQLLRRKPNPTTVDVLAGYAHWAENYPARAHNPLMEIEQNAMLSLLPDQLGGKRCLDLACGSGRYLLLLQKRNAVPVFGLDYSSEMLGQASDVLKPQIARGKCHLTRGTFFPLPFADETFDLITCGLAFGHEENLSRSLLEASRVLRSEGTILYSDFHPIGALVGWKRSFKSDKGAVFNLEHSLHLYSDHQLACSMAGLAIDAVLEPLLGDAAPAYHNFPAVLVVRAFKKGLK